jgi:hypothetical protein
VKAEQGIPMEKSSKTPETTQEAQGRPHSVLVSELREAASKTSTDFWMWWWMLSKNERRTLLDAMV